jgi:hypothetical protein
MVGWGAVGVVVVLWLAISFSQPSRRRERLEWIAATSLYVALSMLFLNLVMRARESDNSFALLAFGFLLLVFACGFVVSLANTVRSLGAEPKAGISATN